MKKHHKTHVLLILFATGLFGLWWADVSGPPTVSESSYVLPGLTKVNAIAIQRIVIESPKGNVVLQRREGNDWQMKEPVDVAAYSAMATTLVDNLRALLRSPESGTIQEAGAKFGFDSPAATIKVFGENSKTPLAGIELGSMVKGFKDERYARPLGEKRIEVIDSRTLSMAELPPIDWREKTLFDLPSFYVARLSVSGPGRELTIQREESHWDIRSPIQAPADDDKVEGVVAELTSLHVAEGNTGFVADNVRDLAPYGLDKPEMSITLTPKEKSRPDQVMLVGKVVPDKPDFRYAMRSNQDDVMLIDAKGIADLGKKASAFRSLRIADVSPGRTTFITFVIAGKTIKLAQSANEWVQLEPVRQKADSGTVSAFLLRLSQLQTSAFFEPGEVAEPQVNPPLVALKVWQAEGKAKLPHDPPSEPSGKPLVNLRLGRIDAIRKAMYAQIEGDKSILALPEAFREVVPKNELTFRDRTLLSMSATQFSHLSIEQGKTRYDLDAPDAPGTSVHWRLSSPFAGHADDEQVTKAVLVLCNLQASEFVTQDPGDEKPYGLDHPTATVIWTLRSEPIKDKPKGGDLRTEPVTGTLRIGSKVAGTEQYYASLAGSKMVFKLSSEFVQPFFGEFHDHRVLSFAPAAQLERLVFRWPARLLSFVPRTQAKGFLPEWQPEFGLDVTGFDVSKINTLIEQLAKLQSDHFAQYYGLFTETYGLTPPRLTIEFQLSNQQKKTLRLGNQSESGPLYATTESGAAGSVFTLEGPAWVELAKAPKRADDLPDQVFRFLSQP